MFGVTILSGSPGRVVGRSRELAELGRILASTRLLTLVGPGGVGKTTLAVELARRSSRRAKAPARFLDLSSITDGRQLADSADLAGEIGDEPSLLVVDNCEHLVDSAAELVGALLERCPRLRLVATSRERLGVRGEAVWAVPPLAPEEAVTLFLVRGRAVSGRLREETAERSAVERLCMQLEGIPLAIELAAARTTLMTPTEIVARLDDRFALLGSGPRSAPVRQRTLRATVDWSHSLLDPEEQRLFRRLSVFAGFDLDAVDGIAGRGSLDVLQRLVDKSMAARGGDRARSRFLMLETLREYGRERLVEAGEAEAMAAAHLAHFCDRAQRAFEARRRTGSAELLHQLELDLDNLRTAVRWALERDPCGGLRLVGLSREVWFHLAQREGLAYARALLAACRDEAGLVRALGLLAAGQLAFTQLEHAAARADLEEADRLAAEIGEAWIRAAVAWMLGVDAFLAEDHLRAREHLKASIRLHEEAGDDVGGAVATASLGTAELRLGNVGVAAELLTTARNRLEAAGDPWGSGFANTYLGIAMLAAGEGEAARESFRRGLHELAPTGDITMLTLGLEGMAELAAPRDWRRALRLAGAAAGLRERHAGPFPRWIAAAVDDLRERGRKSMGAQAADREWARGAALSRSEALALAVGREVTTGERSPLSARETEVARLVADGLSNAAIAKRLGLSERTAENHVQHILDKLAAANRTEIAAWWMRKFE